MKVYLRIGKSKNGIAFNATILDPESDRFGEDLAPYWLNFPTNPTTDADKHLYTAKESLYRRIAAKCGVDVDGFDQKIPEGEYDLPVIDGKLVFQKETLT